MLFRSPFGAWSSRAAGGDFPTGIYVPKLDTIMIKGCMLQNAAKELGETPREIQPLVSPL